MNTPVNQKIAKLLKEKKCDLNHKYMVFTSVETEKYPEGELFLKPTIAEVVMWLYKKHGIWIGVKPSCDGAEWYSEMFTADKQTWGDVDKRYAINTAFRNFKSIHTTPTEAYEAAIEYCLINLIQENK